MMRAYVVHGLCMEKTAQFPPLDRKIRASAASRFFARRTHHFDRAPINPPAT
jgi:hypothetical protein